MDLNSYLSSPRLHIFHVISSISGTCGKARNYFAADLLAVVKASAFFAAFSTVFHCLFSVVTAASSVSFDGVSGSRWSILHYYCVSVHLLLIKSILIVVLLLLSIKPLLKGSGKRWRKLQRKQKLQRLLKGPLRSNFLLFHRNLKSRR